MKYYIVTATSNFTGEKVSITGCDLSAKQAKYYLERLTTGEAGKYFTDAKIEKSAMK